MLFQFLVFIVIGAGRIVQSDNNLDGPALYKITEPVTHAESPFWDGRNNVLNYVDVVGGTIYSYNYTSKEVTSIMVGGNINPVIQSKSSPNLFIAGAGRNIIVIQWNRENGTHSNRTLVTVSDEKPDSQFNEGKADKTGRVWIGTMDQNADTVNHPDKGTLYRVTRDNIDQPEEAIAPVNVSNGLTWNNANNKFYYIDSPSQQIAEYDYNDTTGAITNRRVAFDLNDFDEFGTAVPDGMTVDVDDNLWVALYGGGSVIKVNATSGQLLERHPIPAQDVTSVVFGGPDLDILFVTTSRIDLNAEQITTQPGAGSVYALTNLGTKGVPLFEADLVDAF